MNIYRLFFILMIALAISSCDEDVVIGKDLLDGEQVNTHVKSDFNLTAKTVVGDVIYPFRKGQSRRTFTVGEIEDPVFGKYSSDIYFAPRYLTLPKFSEATTFDSLVLVLAYDTLGNYGNQTALQQLTVSRVIEDFAMRDSISSDEAFETSSILGELSFVPRPLDSITIADLKDPSKTRKVAPQIRVRLSDEFGKALMADSAVAKSDTALLETLKGFKVTSRSNGKSMLGINMAAINTNTLQLYYTKDDTLKEIFQYKLRTEAFAHTEEDRSGSIVESYIDNNEKGEEYLFLQGFRGLDTEFTLPDLSSLKGKIINKAILTLTVAMLSQDFVESEFLSDAQLAAYDTSDGNKTLVADLTSGPLSTTLPIFGGNRTKEGDTVSYTLNITEYLINQVSNDVNSPRLLLSAFNKEQSPKNTVLFGTNNGQQSAKLTVTYTDL